jgi:hypothetical protein
VYPNETIKLAVDKLKKTRVEIADSEYAGIIDALIELMETAASGHWYRSVNVPAWRCNEKWREDILKLAKKLIANT